MHDISRLPGGRELILQDRMLAYLPLQVLWPHLWPNWDLLLRETVNAVAMIHLVMLCQPGPQQPWQGKCSFVCCAVLPSSCKAALLIE